MVDTNNTKSKCEAFQVYVRQARQGKGQVSLVCSLPQSTSPPPQELEVPNYKPTPSAYLIRQPAAEKERSHEGESERLLLASINSAPARR
jgi:hypothetical protein